jgi:riboflavin kinase/FMN adenylyltransferase
MQVLTDIAGLKDLTGPLHLAIGVFDGVHLGHRAVIEAARESAARDGGSAVVVTFDPHPVEVLAPENSPRLLTNTPHKLAVLEREAGIGSVLLVRFDRDFASHLGGAFVERLLQAAPPEGIARICVGEEWRFGKGRSGDVALLERIGKERGFAVSGLGLVEIDSQRVSSTRVREAVAAGDLETAARLLGRRYSVFGAVVRGRQLGRTIGFPTANLAVSREQLPPAGVYAVTATGAGDSWNGVANLGIRPTVEGETGELRLEVHLFGLDHEIYGEELEVTFVRKIRDERKFEGLPALQAQIAEDVAVARAPLSGAVSP